MYDTNKQLNKILTPYDKLLILIDCGCAASRGLLLAIARGFLLVAAAVVTSKIRLMLLLPVADLGFGKGGCPIHQKGAPEGANRRSRRGSVPQKI